MKLALISSVALKTPPSNYGGLERCVYDYAEGLAELGHNVTLIASKGSKAPSGVKLVETVEPWDKLNEAQKKQYGKADRVWNGWRAQEEEAFKEYKGWLNEFDVIGDSSWSKWSYTSKKEEIIGTCHSMKPYNVRPPREHPLFAGVSRAHSRLLAREIHAPARTLWNSVNVESLPFEKLKTDRILSLNRIMPQKGIHLFIQVVKRLGAKADVAGDDSTLVNDQNYVNAMKTECAKDPNITYHGLVDDRKRIQLLKDAKCMVALKDVGYEEIFGLSAVEALACGTSVVALHSWGFDDIIESGKNGFLCDNLDQVVDAVGKIGQIKPEDCRESAMKFSKEARSKAYAAVLEKVKSGVRW